VALAPDSEGGTVTAPARTTVIAAVDGMAGPPEGDFLVAAYKLRGNLSVYDPVLKVSAVQQMLTKQQVPLNAVTLTAGSVAAFGQRVPQTELLIPHPGWDWASEPGDGGLAACIEHVLGTDSYAYVLTDNDMSNKSQVTVLDANLKAVNSAHAQEPGYVALTWTITKLSGLARGDVLSDFGRVPMKIRHDGPYHLVVVHRQ
jgi:hypothetical protein